MKSTLIAFGSAAGLSLFTGRITDIIVFGCATAYALFTDTEKKKVP